MFINKNGNTFEESKSKYSFIITVSFKAKFGE